MRKLNKSSIQDEMLRFYNSNNKYMTKLKNYNSFYYRGLINVIGLMGDKSLKILDVGCGTGNLLNFLNKRGYSNLYGVEQSSLLLKNAKNLSSIKYINSNFLDSIFDSRYGVIINSGVLEHTVYPKKIIDKQCKILNKDGLLLIQGPNLLNLSISFIFSYRSLIFLFKYFLSFFKGGMKEIIINPRLDKKTYLVEDSDASYLMNPFDISYFLSKNGMSVLYSSTFFNPYSNYNSFKKRIILFLKKIPFLKFLGGSVFIVATKNNSIFDDSSFKEKLTILVDNLH